MECEPTPSPALSPASPRSITQSPPDSPLLGDANHPLIREWQLQLQILRKEPNVAPVEGFLRSLSQNLPVDIPESFASVILKIVNAILSRRDFDASASRTVMLALQQVMVLTSKFLATQHQTPVELLVALHNILSDETTVPYYGEGSRTKVGDIQGAIEELSLRIPDGMESCSSNWLENVVHFFQMSGFSLLLHELAKSGSLTQRQHALEIFSNTTTTAMLSPEIHEDLEKALISIQESALALSDDALKSEKRAELTDLFRTMEQVFGLTSPTRASQLCDSFRLKFALKCFQCSILERRIQGINEIRDLCAAVAQHEELLKHVENFAAENPNHPVYPVAKKWLTSEILTEWLEGNSIIAKVYGEAMHPEIVRRATDILKFLSRQNKITRDHIDLVWRGGEGKHESVVLIIYEVVGLLTPHLPLHLAEYLFEKIQSIPFEDYELSTLSLIRTFSLSAIQLSSPPAGEFGMSLLWDILQDDSSVTHEVATSAFQHLLDFLNWPVCHVFSNNFVENCQRNLKNHQSVPQALKVLKTIFGTLVEGDDGKHPIVELDDEYDIMELVFDDINVFRSAYAEAVVQAQPVDVDQFAWNSKYTYLEHVTHRLDFIEYVLEKSPLTLSKNQIDILWDAFITDGLSDEAKSVCFVWLKRAYSSSNFPYEVSEHIFRGKMTTLKYSELKLSGYHFLESVFHSVNRAAQQIKVSDDEKTLTVVGRNLIGVENLWKLALEAEDPDVGNASKAFLISLYSRVDPSQDGLTNEKLQEFVDKCFEHLDVKVDGMDSSLRVERCLCLLEAFLSTFEGILAALGSAVSAKHGQSAESERLKVSIVCIQGPSFEVEVNTTDTLGRLRKLISEKWDNQRVRLITAGAELVDDGKQLSQLKFTPTYVVHVTRNLRQPTEPEYKLPPASPGDIISAEHFGVLFSLLESQESVASLVWKVLQMIPTNGNVLETARNPESATVVQYLVDFHCPYKLVYFLQVLDHCASGRGIESKDEWRTSFVAANGHAHLATLVLSLSQTSIGVLHKTSLRLALKVLLFSVAGNVNVKALEVTSLDPSCEQLPVEPLIAAMCALMVQIALVCEADIESDMVEAGVTKLNEGTSESKTVVQYAATLLLALCRTYPEAFRDFFYSTDFSSFLSETLFACKSAALRATFVEAIALFSGIHMTADISVASELVIKLMGFNRNAPTFKSTCKQYYSLLEGLLRERPTEEDLSHPFKQLCSAIRDEALGERRGDWGVDYALVGCMYCLKVLILRDEVLRAPECLELPKVLMEFLFAIPPFDDDEGILPKCKSKLSRHVAFELLLGLGESSPDIHMHLMSRFTELHSRQPIRSLWQYLPHAHEKASSGFVGLKNLGATCYMNSLLQVLFMNPQFREGILKAKTDCTGESLLDQTKLLLGYLSASEKKFYDTSIFCQSGELTFDGQPLNKSQQMDADEFFAMYFDKLETALKSTEQKHLLREVFGGTVSHQLICKGCPHSSEREESVFNISVDVKNKKHLLESLDLYVEGEMLVGDNQYKCEPCNKKVDTLMRSCLNVLPKHLIVHLKRFEFDFDQMRKVKIDDFCEFPFELDLEPYTKDGLARREGKTVENPTIQETKYILSGVIVHSGTADSGHYYSFIKVKEEGLKQGKWFHFNDTLVETFDSSDIPKCCFGGSESVQQWDPMSKQQVSRWHLKHNNAYMLVYEQNGQRFQHHKASSVIPDTILRGIYDENVSFLRDKHMFDKDHFLFLWHLIHVRHAGELKDQAIVLATNFVVLTLAHAKEKEDLETWIKFLLRSFQESTSSCVWFVHTLVTESWHSSLLLNCTSTETRKQFASLIVGVLRKISPLYPPLVKEDSSNEAMSHASSSYMSVDKNEDSLVVVNFINSMLSLLGDATSNGSRCIHYFAVLYDFACLGKTESAFLIARRTIYRFLSTYLGEESPLSMGPNCHRQKKSKTTERVASENLHYMIATVAHLVTECESVSNLSDDEITLITSAQFLTKVIRDDINIRGVTSIVTHLCQTDEERSRLVLDRLVVALEFISSEYFSAYFDVICGLLSLDDGLQSQRVQLYMTAFVALVNKMRSGTYRSDKKQVVNAIKAINSLATRNDVLFHWLIANREAWVSKWLLDPDNEEMRETCAVFLNSLVEEELPTEDGTLDIQQVILQELVNLIPSLQDNLTRPRTPSLEYDDPSIWRLNCYFRCLRTYIQSDTDKQKFQNFIEPLSSILIRLDSCHWECDLDKMECLNVLVSVCHNQQKNLEAITSNEAVVEKLMDFFICLRPMDRFIVFNQLLLPSYYVLIRDCCTHSPAFLEQFMKHRNWDWALTYVVMESSDYGEATNIMFGILQMCLDRDPSSHVPITKRLLDNELSGNFRNILRYFGLLTSYESAVRSFVSLDGLDIVTKFFDGRSQWSDPDWASYSLKAMEIILHMSSPLQKGSEDVKSWGSKKSCLISVLHMLDTCSDDAAISIGYCLVLRLASLDDEMLETTVSSLISTFDDGDVAMTSPCGSPRPPFTPPHSPGGQLPPPVATPALPKARFRAAYENDREGYQTFLRQLLALCFHDEVDSDSSSFRRGLTLMFNTMMETVDEPLIHADTIRLVAAVCKSHPSISSSPHMNWEKYGEALFSESEPTVLNDKDCFTFVREVSSSLRTISSEKRERSLDDQVTGAKNCMKEIQSLLQAEYSPSVLNEALNKLLSNLRALQILCDNAPTRDHFRDNHASVWTKLDDLISLPQLASLDARWLVSQAFGALPIPTNSSSPPPEHS